MQVHTPSLDTLTPPTADPPPLGTNHLVADLRDALDLADSSEQAHIFDEIEAVALSLRCCDQPVEHLTTGRVGDRNWARRIARIARTVSRAPTTRSRGRQTPCRASRIVRDAVGSDVTRWVSATTDGVTE